MTNNAALSPLESLNRLKEALKDTFNIETTAPEKINIGFIRRLFLGDIYSMAVKGQPNICGVPEDYIRVMTSTRNPVFCVERTIGIGGYTETSMALIHTQNGVLQYLRPTLPDQTTPDMHP